MIYILPILGAASAIMLVLTELLKIQKWRNVLRWVALSFLTISAILTPIQIREKVQENNKLNKQITKIEFNVDSVLNTTTNGFDTILHNYQKQTKRLLTNFQDNYDSLMNTIIEQSDSALNSQITVLQQRKNELDSAYNSEKETTDRYYFSTNWPTSLGDDTVSHIMFYFIPMHLKSYLTGVDKYVIWYLIQNEGKIQYSNHTYQILNDEIKKNVKPMSWGAGSSVHKLSKLNIIREDYYETNIEFSKTFYERYEIYETHYGTDEYPRKMLIHGTKMQKNLIFE